MPFLLVKKDGKYGIYDLTGKEIVRPEFEYIDSPRTEGIPVCAVSEYREKEGVLSTEGKIIINPEDFTSCRVEEKVPVIIVKDKDGKSGLLRYDGSPITGCVFGGICGFSTDGTAVAWEGENRNDEKYGLIDINGKWLIPAQYESLYNISDGLIGAKQDGKWGFIDERNEWIITPKYDRISQEFRNGYSKVEKDGKYVLINKNGEELTKPSSTLELWDPSDGMIMFKVGRKYGYLNQTGGIAIKPTFDDAEEFEHGCALVSLKVNKEPMWTFVRKDGTTGEPFSKKIYHLDRAMAVEKDGRIAFYRPDGTLAIPFVLKKAERFFTHGVAFIQFA